MSESSDMGLEEMVGVGRAAWGESWRMAEVERGGLGRGLMLEVGEIGLEVWGWRVVWWPARRRLLCADLHLGKDAVLRACGVPVPMGSDFRTLERLRMLVEVLGARELVVLGDLYHGREGCDFLASSGVGEFFQAMGVARFLVSGNHDAGMHDLARRWGFEVWDEGREVDGVRLYHLPPEGCGDVLVLAGHWHPSVRLGIGARAGVRFSAFVLDGERLVLPSFGELTGTADVELVEGRRLFLCVEAGGSVEVREVSGLLRRGRSRGLRRQRSRFLGG